MNAQNRPAGKNRGLTQQSLAEKVGVQALQIHRYESGASQPTLEIIRNLAVALSVSSDELIFDDERGPDQELRLQFEAISQFDPEEKKAIKMLLESMILALDNTHMINSHLRYYQISRIIYAKIGVNLSLRL